MSELRWPRDPGVLLAAAFAVACAAAVLFAGRYVPYIDWSNHVGLIGILAHGGENGATAYFDRSLAPTPYLLFYAVSAGIAQLVSVDVAARAAVALSAAGWVFGAAHLAEATGRDPRSAVLAPLAMYGVSLGYGFASFVFSGPLVLFALGSAERVLTAERPALRTRVLELGAAVALVFLGHALLFLFLAGCLLVRVLLPLSVGVIRARSITPLLRGVAPFAAATVPALLLAAPSITSFLQGGWREEGTEHAEFSFEPLSQRLAALPGHLLERGSSSHVLVMEGVVVWVVLMTMLRIAGGASRPRTLGLELYALVAVGVWAFGPMGTPSVWFVYPRFAVFAALLVTLLPGPSLRGLRGVLALSLGIALVGSNAWLNGGHVARFSEWATPYDAVRAAIPPGKKILPLNLDGPGDPELIHPALTGLHFYLAADGAAYLPFLFDNPGVPARYRRDVVRPPAPFWRNVQSYDPAREGVAYDFVVLRGRDAIARTEAHGGFTRVRESGGWVVFERR